MATSAEKSKNIAQHCCCTIRTSGNRPNCAALKLLDNMAMFAQFNCQTYKDENTNKRRKYELHANSCQFQNKTNPTKNLID